jgi:hypothetical protein
MTRAEAGALRVSTHIREKSRWLPADNPDMNAKSIQPPPATLPPWLLEFIAPFEARMTILESYLNTAQREDADDQFRCACESNGWSGPASLLPATACVVDLGAVAPHPSPKASL